MTDLPVHTPEEQQQIADAHQKEAELQASRAYTLEEQIVAAVGDIRRSWVRLAADLYAFHSEECWTSLGYDSLEHWLASPDIEIGRRMFFVLVETHRELVVQRMLPMELLETVDMSKVQDVLPSIRRGQVDVRTAIADCEALTRTDLRDKYNQRPLDKDRLEDKPVQPDSFHYEKCPECGQKMKVSDV